MAQLWYYAHRYTDADPAVQRWNLDRAKERLECLHLTMWMDLWAPWIELADHGTPDDLVWPVIEASIRASAGLLVDLDETTESKGWSPGLIREASVALGAGKDVLVVGSQINNGTLTPERLAEWGRE